MEPASSSAQTFDTFAEVYDRFAHLVGDSLLAYLDTVVPTYPGHDKRAVDLGCGTGRHAVLLAGHYREVLAVDISRAMLDIATTRRRLNSVVYQQRDLRDVRPATDGRFDLVLSAYALHHVDDLDQTLQGIRELATPGGRVILIDNVAPRPAVPHRWFLAEAIRILVMDLLRRRRPAEKAWELFRLNTHPAWLEHVTSDRFLSPDEFSERYSEVFPGAQFTDLYRARAMCWDAAPLADDESTTSRSQGS